MATLTTFTANTQIKSAEVNGNFTGLSDGTMDIDHNSLQIFRDEALYDFVNSGGVWTADSAGVNRNASMTALVTTIDGWRSSISAVTARSFTASKDTYVDVLRTTTTTALVYTEVANNAASPALASNSLRLAIVVTGATTIATANSVNQGQEDRVLPIASSVPYTVTDSLGNLICNRSPSPGIIGYRQMVAIQGSITAAVDITALSIVPFLVPTARKVELELFIPQVTSTTAGDRIDSSILEGATTHQATFQTAGAQGCVVSMKRTKTLSAGLHTIKANVGRTGVGTASAYSDTTLAQAYLLARLV